MKTAGEVNGFSFYYNSAMKLLYLKIRIGGHSSLFQTFQSVSFSEISFIAQKGVKCSMIGFYR